MQVSKYRSLSIAEAQALRIFANANGRAWKSKLNIAWSTGRYDDYPGTGAYGALQQVRNTFGPSWLVRFRFADVSTHSVQL